MPATRTGSAAVSASTTRLVEVSANAWFFTATCDTGCGTSAAAVAGGAVADRDIGAATALAGTSAAAARRAIPVTKRWRIVMLITLSFRAGTVKV